MPFYNAPPYDGDKVHGGLNAGTIFGPVKEIYHCLQQGNKPGLTAVRVPNPYFRDEKALEEMAKEGRAPQHIDLIDEVWINVWSSHNSRGEDSGVAYCSLLPMSNTELDPKLVHDGGQVEVCTFQRNEEGDLLDVHRSRDFTLL